MKKIIHTDTANLGQLHCDACGYDLPEPLKAEQVLSGELIGHLCPRCGADMLTREDWEAAVRMFRVFAWINRWFGWLGHEEVPADAEPVGVRLHDGKVIVSRRASGNTEGAMR